MVRNTQLGNRVYEFRRKPKFPKKLSREYLVVDLLNNLKYLAEEEQMVLNNLKSSVGDFDTKFLYKNAQRYGTVRTKKIIQEIL